LFFVHWNNFLSIVIVPPEGLQAKFEHGQSSPPPPVTDPLVTVAAMKLYPGWLHFWKKNALPGIMGDVIVVHPRVEGVEDQAALFPT